MVACRIAVVDSGKAARSTVVAGLFGMTVVVVVVEGLKGSRTMVCWMAVGFSARKRLPECRVRCLPVWSVPVGRPPIPSGTTSGTQQQTGIGMVSWKSIVVGTSTCWRMRSPDRRRTSCTPFFDYL